MRELIITSSVLIAVTAALRLALKGRINPRLQYALWAVVLIRLLLPFSLFSSPVSVMNTFENLSSWEAPAPPAVSTEGTSKNAVTQRHASDIIPVDIAPVNTVLNTSNDSTADYKHIAKIIWYCGIALVGASLFVTNLVFYARLRRVRRQVFIAGINTPIYIAENLSSSCLFGIFSPAIYITQEVACDETRLRHVLAHELTHKKHLDNIWSLLRCLCLAIHWYNPLVWFAAKLSKQDAELACDESTIKKLGEENRLEYGKTLINLTVSKHSPTDILYCATTMALGKKSINERIMLIAKKPKMMISTVISVILIVALTVCCTFTGKENTPQPTDKPTDFTLHASAYSRLANGDIYNPNNRKDSYFNRFSSQDGTVNLSYDRNGHYAAVPILLHNNCIFGNSDFLTSGFFISPEKTAVVCRKALEDNILTVLTSDDKGQSWSSSAIKDNLTESWISVGFSSPENGWLIVCGSAAMGSEEHRLYATSNGGKAWKAVDTNIDEVYGRVLSGAGFMDSQNGFMCFRYESGNPAVCVTRDGGKTWKALDIQLPSEYAAYTKTPLSPSFDGSVTILPVLLGNEFSTALKTIYLESCDYGASWSIRSGEKSISDEEANALFAKSSGDIDDYLPELIAGNHVSEYDFLPCLESFNIRTWQALNEKYGDSWFNSLFSAIRRSAIGSGQYMRDYYVGKAFFASDGACTEGLREIIVTQWLADSSVYAKCLREGFSDRDSAPLREMLCYWLFDYQNLVRSSITFSKKATISLTNYPELFPLSRYGDDKKVTISESDIEGYGKSITAECGGQRERFIETDEGVYYLYDIFTTVTGDRDILGISVGDKADEIDKIIGNANIIRTDKLAVDDYGGRCDEVLVYRLDDSSYKYVAYVIVDDFVRAIQSIDGLGKALY